MIRMMMKTLLGCHFQVPLFPSSLVWWELIYLLLHTNRTKKVKGILNYHPFPHQIPTNTRIKVKVFTNSNYFTAQPLSISLLSFVGRPFFFLLNLYDFSLFRKGESGIGQEGFVCENVRLHVLRRVPSQSFRTKYFINRIQT